MLAQDGSLLQRIDHAIGVHTALKTEGGISAETMAAGALTYPCGVEVGALQHHMFGGLVGTATLAAEHAGNTHGLIFIADGEVVCAKGVLHTVEGHKLGALWLGLHHDMVSGHHVGVETMEGLSVGHHHIIGDVHDIIDGAQSDGGQFVAQPFR